MTGERYGFGPGGRPTRFMASREARRHVERGGDTDTPDPQVRELGEHAAELLKSPAFEHAFASLMADAEDDLINSEPGQPGEAQRTRAHFKMFMLSQLSTKLQAMAEDGKIAALADAQNSIEQNA